jgi:hypothetical protein
MLLHIISLSGNVALLKILLKIGWAAMKAGNSLADRMEECWRSSIPGSIRQDILETRQRQRFEIWGRICDIRFVGNRNYCWNLRLTGSKHNKRYASTKAFVDDALLSHEFKSFFADLVTEPFTLLAMMLEPLKFTLGKSGKTKLRSIQEHRLVYDFCKTFDRSSASNYVTEKAALTLAFNALEVYMKSNKIWLYPVDSQQVGETPLAKQAFGRPSEQSGYIESSSELSRTPAPRQPPASRSGFWARVLCRGVSTRMGSSGSRSRLYSQASTQMTPLAQPSSGESLPPFNSQLSPIMSDTSVNTDERGVDRSACSANASDVGGSSAKQSESYQRLEF